MLAFVLLYGARHPPGLLSASRLRLAALSGALWIATGQAITIGLTLAALWLPYYARQTASERGLALALRNPASTGALSLLLPLSLLVSTGTAVVSTRHPWWPSANVAFQVRGQLSGSRCGLCSWQCIDGPLPQHSSTPLSFSPSLSGP